MIDDINMVPEWAIQQVLEMETGVTPSVELYKLFTRKEPEAANWILGLVESDVARLKAAFEPLNTIPNFDTTLKFILKRMFLRGWQIANARWVTQDYKLPGEDVDINPMEYKPHDEDFD